MADLNIRIWGTFEDNDGLIQVIDRTYENVDGLFASTFKWEENHCEQETAELGTIKPINWAKMIEIIGDDAGKDTFMKAVAYAAQRLGIDPD